MLCIGRCFALLVTTMFQSEFIMGLADLTGELMRNAINSLATGNTEVKLLLMDLFQSFIHLFRFASLFWHFCKLLLKPSTSWRGKRLQGILVARWRLPGAEWLL